MRPGAHRTRTYLFSFVLRRLRRIRPIQPISGSRSDNGLIRCPCILKICCGACEHDTITGNLKGDFIVFAQMQRFHHPGWQRDCGRIGSPSCRILLANSKSGERHYQNKAFSPLGGEYRPPFVLRKVRTSLRKSNSPAVSCRAKPVKIHYATSTKIRSRR